MDFKDEFEFKPLSEGLGFHKKKENKQNQSASELEGEHSVQKSMSSLFNKHSQSSQSSQVAKTLNMSQSQQLNQSKQTNTFPAPQSIVGNSSVSAPIVPQTFSKNMIKEMGTDFIDQKKAFKSPLPRNNSNNQPISHNHAVNEILNTLQKNKKLDFVDAKTELQKTVSKTRFVADTQNFFAMILDALLIVAASMLCLIVALTVTKVDIIRHLQNPLSDLSIYIATGVLFSGVVFLYLTINRLIAGCTPGEWAYEQTLGNDEDQKKLMYSFKVIFRSIVIMATGIILLPLLSLIFNVDLAGKLSGTQLYRKG